MRAVFADKRTRTALVVVQRLNNNCRRAFTSASAADVEAAQELLAT